MLEVPVPDVRAVDDEDDGMAGCVVALPEFPEGVLPTHVPDLQVHIWQGDGRHILTYRRHGLEFRRGVGGEEEGFDLFVEGGFAGIVEAEEEDGIFWLLD